MNRFTVATNQLWHGTTSLGPATALYAYPGEQHHLGPDQAGVVVCNTPGRIDLLFAVGERVAGAEVKTTEDLISSWRSRRLQRQLRLLRGVVDVPMLLVRGGLPQSDDPALLPFELRFWEDLLNAQTQGVYVLPVPRENWLPHLLGYRKALATTGVRVLAGTDLHPARERRPGWLLRRIPGIGPERSAHLIAVFGNSLGALQAATKGDVAKALSPSIEEKLYHAATG